MLPGDVRHAVIAAGAKTLESLDVAVAVGGAGHVDAHVQRVAGTATVLTAEGAQRRVSTLCETLTGFKDLSFFCFVVQVPDL